MPAENIALTQEQFQQLLTGLIAGNAANTNNQSGSFATCSSRFSGREGDSADAFISAITIYKDCTNVSDENALKGLPMLLDGPAATWWQGTKSSVQDWEEAITSLKHAFGVNKPGHVIFRELFEMRQSEGEPTDIFVNNSRALLSHIASQPVLHIQHQLDMIYGLLQRQIRERVNREQVTTFETDNATNSTNKERVRCKFCKHFGHTKEDCRKFERSQPSSTSKPPDVTNDRNFTPVACYRCGLPGYISSQCPCCKSTRATTSNATNTNDAATIELLYNEIQLSPERPLLKVNIEGICGLACVDTGAKRNVAGQRLRSPLENIGHPSTQLSFNLIMADGRNQLVEAWIYEVEVSFTTKTLKTSFISVAAHPDAKTLLGVDFIKQAEMILDIPNMQWRFIDEETFYKLDDVSGSTANGCNDYMCSLRSDKVEGLDQVEEKELRDMLQRNEDIFKRFNEPTPFAEHHINLTTDVPIATTPHWMSPVKKDILKKKIEEMADMGIIEECESPYSAPVVLVPKKNSDYRVCIDYRRLNEVAISDQYPLPRIDDLLHTATQTAYMTTLDLQSGY